MRYMIHAVPSRMWYVEEFLVPSMKDQGITDDEIYIWNDTEGKGNLHSCMNSFIYCGEHLANGTWHIQDDIIISRDFAEKTREYNKDVVCGFVHPKWGPNPEKTGNVQIGDMWYSFQCIHIPDGLAQECALWFYHDASRRKDAKYSSRIARKKHDDDFFRYFMLERKQHIPVINLKPNIVDHIDYLIGGTLINQNRVEKINRSAFFPDEDLVEMLEEQLKERNA